MKLKELISNFGGGYYKHLIIGICLLLVIGIFLITLKDSYAYYGGSNELPIIEATIGKLKPTIDKVYIEEENQQYTNNPNPSVTITWTDDNITDYCVTTESACTEFKSIDSNSKSVTTQIQLNGEVPHTVNAYIKNKYGYTSEVKSDQITLDITPPTISDVTSTEITETTITVSVSGNDTNGISQYCYGTNQSDYTCTDSNTHTFNNLNSGQQYTLYIYLIDNAGNISTLTQQPFKTISKFAGDVIIASSNSLESEEDFKARNAEITAAGGDVPDDLRRFVGTKDQVTDNFICFGTDNQETCKSNMDTYMYRIIGIDTQNRLKLIKATKIVNGSTSTFQWHSTYSSNTKWNASSLYSGLNNGYFMSNTKYSYMQQTQWTNLIDPSTYYIGDSEEYNNPTVFQNERKEHFDSGKISLMYLSDYLYANNGIADTTNWLFIANGLNGTNNTPIGSTAPSGENEWTMTRYGYSSNGGAYTAWLVNRTGSVIRSTLTDTRAVRPVFYLKSNVKVAGKGTLDNPYMIALN